jgi:hypothetical protein
MNINVPENSGPLFNFANATLVLSFIGLISFIALFNTVLILHYKEKLNLTLRFKNYPIILKIINYYEKASYVNII